MTGEVAGRYCSGEHRSRPMRAYLVLALLFAVQNGQEGQRPSPEAPLSAGQNPIQTQTIRVLEPDHPISGIRGADQRLELVKLNGDALSESSHNVFTKPNFKKLSDASKRHNALKIDCEFHPVIFLGTASDRDFLFNELRALRRTEGHQPVIFLCPDLRKRQIEMLSEQAGIYVDIDGAEFLIALSKVFPNGRNLDDIAEATTGFKLTNKELRDIIANSFTVLTTSKFEELSRTPDIEGGIYSFYKGEAVHWSDIILGIYADLTPYKNWRNRIALQLEDGFPGGKAFLLASPAGMGKSVGLMVPPCAPGMI